MKKIFVLLAMFVSTIVSAECTKDTDCKGNRICSVGVCVVDDAPTEVPVQDTRLTPVETIQHSLIANQTQQLKKEIAEMHEELEDATLAGPIVKLILATGATGSALSFLGLSSNARDCENKNLHNCGNSSTYLTSMLFSAAAAVTFWIWGGVQLRNRIRVKQTFPNKIRIKEEQLELLSR